MNMARGVSGKIPEIFVVSVAPFFASGEPCHEHLEEENSCEKEMDNVAALPWADV
jgi:hypothetical protein